MIKFPIIYYKIDSTSVFCEPPPITNDNMTGIFKLDKEHLKIELKNNINSITEAKEILEPILRSWRLEADITNHPACGFDFKFYKAQILNPKKDINHHFEEKLRYSKNTNDDLVIGVRVYPPYPSTLFTKEMEIAWERYRKASIGVGESIESAVYFIVTLLKKSLNKGFKETAKLLSIDFKILTKLGEFSSTRGDAKTYRKYFGEDALKLSNLEKWWIDQAVRNCLFNLGKYNAGKNNEFLKMDDLINLNTEI